MREQSIYFREGVEAYKRGTKCDRNPHKGRVSNPEWSLGWMHAALDAGDYSFALEPDDSDFGKALKKACEEIGSSVREATAKPAPALGELAKRCEWMAKEMPAEHKDITGSWMLNARDVLRQAAAALSGVAAQGDMK